MSAQSNEDREIAEMMARNQRGKVVYIVAAVVALILIIAVGMSYFASIAAAP